VAKAAPPLTGFDLRLVEWSGGAEPATRPFAGTRNPAIAVVAEMLEWVRAGTAPAVSANASSLPWVTTTNRNAYAKFAELVSVFAARDAARAGRTWAACLEATSPFSESSDLGRRLDG